MEVVAFQAGLGRKRVQDQEKAKEVYMKLNIQNQERSMEHRRRWYAGLLRWKRRRHVNALETVLARIESREFRHPEDLVTIMGKIRDKQKEVFALRKEWISDVFNTGVDDLKVDKLKKVEESLSGLNDRTAEEYDNLFVELKELKDTIFYKGEGMLNQLRTELELYDARIEWGDHESIKALIDADVRPHLQVC